MVSHSTVVLLTSSVIRRLSFLFSDNSGFPQLNPDIAFLFVQSHSQRRSFLSNITTKAEAFASPPTGSHHHYRDGGFLHLHLLWLVSLSQSFLDLVNNPTRWGELSLLSDLGLLILSLQSNLGLLGFFLSLIWFGFSSLIFSQNRKTQKNCFIVE